MRAVYYTGPQSFIIMFSYSLAQQLYGLPYLVLISWLIKLSVQTFQSLIVIYKRGDFVYHNWACTSIYRPLSYPIRFQVLLCRFWGMLMNPFAFYRTLGKPNFIYITNGYRIHGYYDRGIFFVNLGS